MGDAWARAERGEFALSVSGIGSASRPPSRAGAVPQTTSTEYVQELLTAIAGAGRGHDTELEAVDRVDRLHRAHARPDHGFTLPVAPRMVWPVALGVVAADAFAVLRD
ncbi:hypothetical protein [Micromonospora sp. NPDC005206]|uniref:hypothetical protein n=1 Tax=Micromonospora sp. NPDC005206 TaxID=3157022 RepID=UPI0033A5599C